MKEAKIVLYPIFGAYQFVLAATKPWPLCALFYATGFGLIGLSILHLRNLLKEGQK
jgi:hypothetical protein